MIVRVTMDLFQHRYYRLNKTMMTLIGQWPYQSSRTKYCFRAVIIYDITSELLSRIWDIANHRNDFGILVNCTIPIIVTLRCIVHFIVLTSNSQKTLQLLNRIKSDWQVWARHREFNILHEYTEEGRKINVVLTVLTYFAFLTDLATLVVLKIIDILLNNGTEPGKFPTHVDYYRVDTQKYYFYVMVYYCIILVTTAMVLMANHIMLITYVQHACGIFAALGEKLERIGSNDTAMETTETAYELAKRNVVNLAWCIERHNGAIEYANLIDGLYTWNNGFTILCGMSLINVIGLQILTNSSDLEVTTRLIFFTCSILFLFSIDCHVAQKLMDHSINIGFNIHNSEWYRLPIEAQKLVQFMMLRCIVSCELTAGKIMILSVNTCGRTIRTAASYFTILRSTRGL